MIGHAGPSRYLAGTTTLGGQASTQARDFFTVETIPTAGLPEWIRQILPKLLRLTRIGDNWDSYGSLPPSADLAKTIIESLHFTEVLTLPPPEVVPAAGGGLQLEWYMGARELEIEYDKTGCVAYLKTDRERNTEEEDRIALDPEGKGKVRELLNWVGEMA